MKIENLKNCTGCNACYSVCPKHAIIMQQNEEGFLYPKVENQNCIKCNLCEKVCPAIEALRKYSTFTTTVYAAINRDEKIRLESSSGGIFTALAEKVIDENGVVFGAKFAEDFSVIHSWTDKKEGLCDLRGSKYLQSVIGQSYIECKSFLENDRKVLFSGTPCQIQGLLKYLETIKCTNWQNNLITVDFICHGVPSPLLWKKYIEYREKKSASRTVKTAFRRKNQGWKQYSLSFTFANDSEYCSVYNKDPYMQLFLKNIVLRNSCYSCHCRGVERNCDITIADFWGIETVMPEMDDNKGTSVIVIHSKKGDSLITSLNNCLLKTTTVEIIKQKNPSIEKSYLLPKSRVSFYSDLKKLSFDKIIKKYAVTSVYLRAYIYIRSFLGTIKRMVAK